MMNSAWYVQIMGEEHGPYSASQMQRLIAQGTIQPDTFVRNDVDWVLADSVQDWGDITADDRHTEFDKDLPKKRYTLLILLILGGSLILLAALCLVTFHSFAPDSSSNNSAVNNSMVELRDPQPCYYCREGGGIFWAIDCQVVVKNTSDVNPLRGHLQRFTYRLRVVEPGNETLLFEKSDFKQVEMERPYESRPFRTSVDVLRMTKDEVPAGAEMQLQVIGVNDLQCHSNWISAPFAEVDDLEEFYSRIAGAKYYHR